MTSFLRVLRLFSLVTWVGGLLFFVTVVTPVAFSSLPDTHTAGMVVRGSLLSLHRIGFGAGIVYLVATLTLIGTQRDSHLARAAEVLLVMGMLLITAYLQFSVLPRMEADRTSLGGDVSTAPAEAPARRHFNRLHGVSVKAESTVLLGGILLVCLAPLPRRSELDRSQF